LLSLLTTVRLRNCVMLYVKSVAKIHCIFILARES
jgi:hypothetical protein